jgi:hypothetical protein
MDNNIDFTHCSCCILPKTYPNITFNNEGICNYCQTKNDIDLKVKGEDALKKILGNRKGAQYDCVVPVSGGKDSSYVLYYAKKKLDLRVLAVHYDHGFGVDLARKNIDTACKILEIPLIVVKVNIKNHKKMLKEILLMSDIIGNFFNTCGNCETGIKMAAWNVAKKYQIPFILLGDSKFEHIEEPKGKTLKRINQKGLTDKWRFFFHLTKYWYFNVRQRNELKVPLRYRFSLPGREAEPDNGVKFLHFFDFIEWGALNKVKFLKETIGYETPIDQPHRYDCILHCFGNYQSIKDNGISRDGINFSTMIRLNLLDPVDAMRLERYLEDHILEETKKTLETLGLSSCCKSLLNRNDSLKKD